MAIQCVIITLIVPKRLIWFNLQADESSTCHIVLHDKLLTLAWSNNKTKNKLPIWTPHKLSKSSAPSVVMIITRIAAINMIVRTLRCICRRCRRYSLLYSSYFLPGFIRNSLCGALHSVHVVVQNFSVIETDAQVWCDLLSTVVTKLVMADSFTMQETIQYRP